jgi:Zn-dependent peptidase ImmA (M78 family)
MKKSAYEIAYHQIFKFLINENIIVYDTAIHGPGLAIDLRHGGPKRLVCIDGKLPWKNRLFVILHEVGHLFYFKGIKFKPRKTPASEVQANITAIKLLHSLSNLPAKNIHLDYARYYNKIAKVPDHDKFILD